MKLNFLNGIKIFRNMKCLLNIDYKCSFFNTLT